MLDRRNSRRRIVVLREDQPERDRRQSALEMIRSERYNLITIAGCIVDRWFSIQRLPDLLASGNRFTVIWRPETQEDEQLHLSSLVTRTLILFHPLSGRQRRCS